jgi:hypothetical protein
MVESEMAKYGSTPSGYGVEALVWCGVGWMKEWI